MSQNQDYGDPSKLPGTGRPSAANLRLVVSNPPVQKSAAIPKPAPSTAGFSSEVWNRGIQLYEMKAQDQSHCLECSLSLEVEEVNGEYGGGTVICHFPTIDGNPLREFVEGDKTLYGVLMAQFQVRIMERLLLFCATHYASELIVSMDKCQAEQFCIYPRFVAHHHTLTTGNGEKIEMAIPANQETLAKWIEFMEDVTHHIQQTLWFEQSFNPVVRAYLKSRYVIH